MSQLDLFVCLVLLLNLLVVDHFQFYLFASLVRTLNSLVVDHFQFEFPVQSESKSFP